MLHSPQCTVSEVPDGPPKFPPPPLRHIYQNHSEGPKVPPRVLLNPPPSSPTMVTAPSSCSTMLLFQKENTLQLELAAIRNAYLEKLLEQSRLQQELLSRPMPSALPVSYLEKQLEQSQREMMCQGVSPSPSLPSPTWFSPMPSLPLPCPSDKLEAVMTATQAELDQCGWYYGNLTWQESHLLLQHCQQGTFLVRNSSCKDSFTPYSLSLLRREGPTSIRIQFVNGKFRLHADEKKRGEMPVFSSVGQLVTHYVQLCQRKNTREILIEQEEQDCTVGAVSRLILTSPLLKSPPSLVHAARLAIHKAIGNGREHRGSWDRKRKQLKLPDQLLTYLDNYQLSI